MPLVLDIVRASRDFDPVTKLVLTHEDVRDCSQEAGLVEADLQFLLNQTDSQFARIQQILQRVQNKLALNASLRAIFSTVDVDKVKPQLNQVYHLDSAENEAI